MQFISNIMCDEPAIVAFQLPHTTLAISPTLPITEYGTINFSFL